jgi:hypothetical protein
MAHDRMRVAEPQGNTSGELQGLRPRIQDFGTRSHPALSNPISIVLETVPQDWIDLIYEVGLLNSCIGYLELRLGGSGSINGVEWLLSVVVWLCLRLLYAC